MIIEEIKTLKTGPAELRKFGLLVGGIVLGSVVSRVILTLLFFLVLTPTGLVARLAGKDFLRLKLDRKAASYWIKRERTVKSQQDYEKQF